MPETRPAQAPGRYAQWLDELKLHDKLFEQIDARLPKQLRDTRQRIEKLLTA